MASMFDNERFADESNQPGINPAIPDIQPVVDTSKAVGYEMAGQLLDMGLDLKDMYTQEKLRREFMELDEEQQSALAAERGLFDQMLEGINAQDAGKIQGVSSALTKLNFAEKQGRLGSTAVSTKKAALVRQALADTPWLATEIRQIASTYSVPGFGGSGSSGGSENPLDAFSDMEKEMVAAAHRMAVAGVSEKQIVPAIRQWALGNKNIAAQLNSQDKAQVTSALINMMGGGWPSPEGDVPQDGWATFYSQLEGRMKASQGTADWNPDQFAAEVSAWEERQFARMKVIVNQKKAEGAYFDMSDDEIRSLVGLNSASVKMQLEAQPTWEEYEKQRYALNANKRLDSLERMAAQDALFGGLANFFGLDSSKATPSEISAFMVDYGDFMKVVNTPGAARKFQLLGGTPRAIHELMNSTNPEYAAMGLNMALKEVEKGNPEFKEMTVPLAKPYIFDENKNSVAFDALAQMPGVGLYEAFATAMPPTPTAKPTENAKKRWDAVNSTVNDTRESVFTQAFSDPKLQYTIEYDADKKRFDIWLENPVSADDPEAVAFQGRRKISRDGGISSETAMARSLTMLNWETKVRDRWGWFGDGGRQAFINTALGYNQTPKQAVPMGTPPNLGKDGGAGAGMISRSRARIDNGRILIEEGENRSPFDIEDVAVNKVEDFESASGLTPDELKATIMIESSGDPSVENKFGYKGLLQLGDTRASELGVDDPFNPKQSIEGYARHAKQAATKLQREGLPVDGFTTYLLWQQGLTGGSHILKNTDARVQGYKYQRNVENNPPPDSTYRSIKNPTVGDWVDGWKRVFEKRKTASLDLDQFFA